MANNIFQQQITPIKPKVLESERIYVYVPTATKDIQGVASYNTRDFGVNNGHVSLMWPKQMLVEKLSNPLTQVSNIKVLADEFVNTNNVASITNPITGVTYNSNTAEVMLNRRNRNAFVRPDFVMLDNAKDFESSTDENGFVKYTLKRNNPLEQPSLIHINSADFIREKGIVKINWTNIEKAVSDLETKINKVINTEIQIVDANGNFVAGNGTIGDATTNSIVIGPNAKVALGGSVALLGETWDFVPVAIGSGSEAGDQAVAIGASAKATQFKSLALGAMAEATAGQAVQLGQGTNNGYGTFQFRSFRIIDKDGKVYTNTGTQAAITMKLVATEEYVNSLFSSLQNVTLQIVDTLPTIGKTNIIYLVPVTDGKEDNYYKEYVYIENKWELIGTTKVDLTNYYTKDEIQTLLLNSYKPIMLGGDGVAEDNVYNFVIDNADSYIDYRTNGTKFLVDLLLPIVGDLDKSRRVAITFGDTVYYIYNILGGNKPATIGDLIQINSYNNTVGYRFISEMLFFDTGDIKGFAILPTISVSDILSLNSDEMDNYIAEGGLKQGQLAICNKVITNGYVEGGLYRFDITYPDTYTWTELSSGGGLKIVNVNDTITTDDLTEVVNLTDEQYSELVEKGSIVVDEKTITFNDNTLYVTPDVSKPNTLTFTGTSVLTSNEKFNSHVHIMVEFETDSIHAGFDCVLHPYDNAVCFVTYNVLVNGTPNFATAYLDESGHVVINVPSGLTFSNVHGKYVVYGG